MKKSIAVLILGSMLISGVMACGQTGGKKTETMPSPSVTANPSPTPEVGEKVQEGEQKSKDTKEAEDTGSENSVIGMTSYDKAVKKAEEAKGKGILPKMGQVEPAGILQEETEADKKDTAKVFSPAMFDGTWVLEDSPKNKEDQSRFSGLLKVSRSDGDYVVEALPVQLQFGESSTREFDTGFHPISMKDMGYVQVSYHQVAASDDAEVKVHFGSVGCTMRSGFAVKDQTLAIGFTDLARDEKPAKEEKLTEINYDFSWTGSRLTLSYGGESAVYVPKAYKEMGSKVTIAEARPKLVSDEKNPLVRVLVNQKGGDMVERKYQAMEPATYTFAKDGKLTIQYGKGNTEEMTYYYSESALTLVKEGKVTILACLPEYFEGRPRVNRAAYQCSYWVHDQRVEAPLGKTAGELRSGQYDLEADLEKFLSPGEEMDCSATFNSAIFSIHFKNTSQETKPLKDCLVYGVTIDEKSSVGVNQRNLAIGKATYLDVKDIYGLDGSMEEGRILVQSAEEPSHQMVFSFENDILDHVTYEIREEE